MEDKALCQGELQDDDWMQFAIEEGQKALECNEVPVGCVFVMSGKIIGRGHNKTNLELDATRHAEMVAVDGILAQRSNRSADDIDACPTGKNGLLLSGCTLYVTCEPCIMCASAMSLLGLHRVVFGCPNDKFGGNGSIMNLHKREAVDGGKDVWHGYEVRGGVRHEDGVDLFRKFYARENVKAPIPKRRKEV